MKDIQRALFSAMADIQGSGDFAVSGVHSYAHPGLHVEGIGEISLPLMPAQARSLIEKAAHHAPFGKGSQTLTDRTVRSAWEVDAGQLRFLNPDWGVFLDEVLQTVKNGMGLGEAAVSAHLYKLLLYETGDFFLAHKDSEKEKGMFGTLVLTLPSAHTGGELVIRFDGREKTLGFSAAAAEYKIAYTAFFADCDHEVKPLLSGYRLALVYNLVQSGKGSTIESPHIAAQVAVLKGLLTDLEQTDQPFPLAVLLGHQYTPANFSLHTLKLHDRPRVDALLEAARHANYFACPALLTHYQMGELEHEYRGRSSRYRDDDFSNGYMGEIYESTSSIGYWMEEEILGLGEVSIEEEEGQVWASFGLGEEGEPIEKEAEGYTGNAGMTMTYWYHYGAVVLWPKSQHIDILSARIFPVQLRWMDHYCRHWGTADASHTAQALLKTWIAAGHEPPQYSSADYSVVARILLLANDASLASQSAPLLGAIFSRVAAEQWAELLQHFSPDIFEPAFKHAADKKDRKNTLHLLKVLTLLESVPDAPVRHFFFQQMGRLPSGIQQIGLSDFRRPKILWSFERDDPDRLAMAQGIVEQLLALSRHLDDDEAWVEESLDALVTPLPRHYVHLVLAPILLAAKNERSVLAEALLIVCREYLFERIEHSPVPPLDWSRPVPDIKHSERVWGELRFFLESPTQRVLDCRMAQAQRSEMEKAILDAALDLSMETIRKGSPHVLRLTKTTATYERALQEWGEDRRLYEALSAI